MDRLIRLVKIAHRYPSDYISSQISEMLEDFPAHTPMHRLASLCISYPCVMDNCGHMVSFSSIRVASDDPIPFLFRIALSGPSQSELNQAGRKMNRHRHKAPVGEGKKVQQKKDKHEEGPEGSIAYVEERVSRYHTLKPYEKSTLTKKIKQLLRGNNRARTSPETNAFMDAIDEAGKISDKKKRDKKRKTILLRGITRAEAEIEERQKESEKKQEKREKKQDTGTQSVMSNKPKPSSSSSNSSSPSKPSSGSSSNSSSSSSAPASTFKSL